MDLLKIFGICSSTSCALSVNAIFAKFMLHFCCWNLSYYQVHLQQPPTRKISAFDELTYWSKFWSLHLLLKLSITQLSPNMFPLFMIFDQHSMSKVPLHLMSKVLLMAHLKLITGWSMPGVYLSLFGRKRRFTNNRLDNCSVLGANQDDWVLIRFSNQRALN